MNYLTEFFVKNHKFTIIMSLFLILYGVSGMRSLVSESFPSVNIGAVVVTTPYPGATAEDIETKITKPIEDELQTVSGLKTVKSISQAGFSTIITEVDIDKYDVAEVVSDLQRAVDRASGLPTDLLQKPRFTEIKSDEFPVVELAVIGSNDNRLRDLVADQLKEDVRDNRTVSSVSISGFTERRFNILLRAEDLRKQHVSINEVQAALQQRNVTIPAGELKSEGSQELVRIEGKATSREELSKIVVRANFSGNRVTLGDVATIVDGEGEVTTIASYLGQKATILTIAKKGGADLMKLTSELDALLNEYRQKYKDQLKFEIFSNEGVRVGDRLNVLISNGWQGIVLVVFFLLLFLPGRVGIVTAISLPLALAATLGVVHNIGYSLNTITIIALVIAIGMLVDNAVVISENYTRLRDDGVDNEEAVLKTIRELWAPITATGLTTIAAFLPMMVTTGVMGQFIKGIPIVVSLSLMLSLFESFFLLPTRLKLIGYKPKALGASRKLDFFDRVIVPRFEQMMTFFVDRKYFSLVLFLGIFVGTFAMLAFGNKINLFPSDQTEIYIARLESPKGTRIERTTEITDDVMKQISQTLEGKFLHVVGVSGESRVDPGDPKGEVGSNVSMIRIFVTREIQDKMDTKDVLAMLREIKNKDLLSLSFEGLVNGPPVGDPVDVTFRSNNAAQLEQVAQAIKERLAKEPGVFDAAVDDVFGDNEVTIQIDHEKISRLGLSLAEVGVSVRAAVAGVTLGDVNLDNKNVDYFVQFSSKDRADLSSLRDIKIADRLGNLIPLGSIATFEVKPGSPQIKRYDFRRSKTVTASIDDTKITSIQANKVVKDEFDAIKNNFKDVSIVFGGEAEKTQESIDSLFSALILSLIGIFALMVLIFRSYLSPFIIMTTIPLGLTGVSVSFFLQNMDFSFMALIGVIGLGGIIVNSGIILISFIDQMKEEGKMPLREILVKASAIRLRAVLVTSLTTISGLIPTAYGIGGVDYFIIPMAMALAWGLSSGTILTLIWIPPAYALVSGWTSRGAK